MNRQELFDGNIVHSQQFELGASYPPFIKSIRGSFCDMTYPRFFSGWPYFVLILAALLMGSSSKESSGEFKNQDPTQSLEWTIASTKSLTHQGAQSFFEKTGEYRGSNRCEANSTGLASVLRPPLKKSWCSSEAHQKHSF